MFLPGTKEIDDTRAALLATAEFGRQPQAAAWVLPLHGSLPPEEQRRVFLRPPQGCVKVGLAANSRAACVDVAETSIPHPNMV